MADAGPAGDRTAGSGPAASSSRLQFARSALGQTYVAGQHVVAPLAFTRSFHLDEPNGPCTAILQSVAGPLLGGDDVTLAVEVDAGAHAHVVTAAGAPVHAGAGTASYRTSVRLGAGARLLLAPRPWVLFPGSRLDATTELDLGEEAAAVVVESFGGHDPAGRGRRWGRLQLSTTVRRSGRLVATDRFDLAGAEATAPGLLGDAAWAATLWLLGALPVDVVVAAVRQVLPRGTGATAGVGALPGGCGAVVRVLAADGQQLRDAVSAVEAVGRAEVLGEDRARPSRGGAVVCSLSASKRVAAG